MCQCRRRGLEVRSPSIYPSRMSLAATTAPMPLEGYLAAERVAETKSEFHDGTILTGGGTGPHSQIAVGLTRELSVSAKRRAARSSIPT